MRTPKINSTSWRYFGSGTLKYLHPNGWPSFLRLAANSSFSAAARYIPCAPAIWDVQVHIVNWSVSFCVEPARYVLERRPKYKGSVSEFRTREQLLDLSAGVSGVDC